jgi:hypothetical protein
MTKTINHDITENLQELLSKYHDLVWYARSHPSSDVDFWKGVPDQVMQGAFRGQMRVEEDYPDEVSKLRGDNSDWEHGFNSGMLAALNYVLTASRSIEYDDGEETFWIGGISDAQEEFPMLDT